MRNLRVQYRNISRAVIIGDGLGRYRISYDEFSDVHKDILSWRVGK